MNSFVPGYARGLVLRACALALALFFGAPLSVYAQPKAPPPPTNFFTDGVGVVSAGAASQIEQKLRDLQKASSNQVLVVVADHVPEGYTSIEEYTNRTAEAWRVGDKARDNGAVMFVFVGDRKVRIEVGYGLEGALPDALASRIINDEVTPQFRAGHYDEGIIAGVDAIVAATKGEYQPKAAVGRSRGQTGLIVLIVLIFLFVGVILPFLQEIGAIRSGYRTYSGKGRSGGRRSSGWGSSGGGWWGGGGGGSSWGGGGGGGGFSGGGGSFGGGGASGSW
ncbi:MAG: TPM domain-containing protein [Vicinamibacteria bacterium]